VNPVITAWSAVSPFGLDTEALMLGAPAAQHAAASSVDRERWPVSDETACLVPDFEVREVLGKKGTRSVDRVTGLALTAVGRLVDAGVETGDDTALVLGTTSGGLQSQWETTTDMLVREKPFYIDPARIPYVIMNGTAGQCAIWHQLRGPNTTVAAARTSGLTALNYARRLLATGRARRGGRSRRAGSRCSPRPTAKALSPARCSRCAAEAVAGNTRRDMSNAVETVEKEELRVTLAGVIDVDPQEVSDNAELIADLGVDSLMALEVVVVLEKKYRVKFTEDEMRAVTTLQAAYDLLVHKTAADR
jgi:acyl carrier protein